MAATKEKCEVVDSWEDIDETELLARPFPSLPDGKVQMNIPNGQVIVQEDSVRTQYTAPEPSVKILKRPTKGEDGCMGEFLVNGDGRTAKSSKGRSLQQRQLDYAEARLRIMGEAKSPEDDLDDRLNQMNVGVSSSGNSGSSGSSQSSAPTASITLLRPQVPPSAANANGMDVVRLPKGPDGSPGFSLKR